jgi:hypothetical protein
VAPEYLKRGKTMVLSTVHAVHTGGVGVRTKRHTGRSDRGFQKSADSLRVVGTSFGFGDQHFPISKTRRDTCLSRRNLAAILSCSNREMAERARRLTSVFPVATRCDSLKRL